MLGRACVSVCVCPCLFVSVSVYVGVSVCGSVCGCSVGARVCVGVCGCWIPENSFGRKPANKFTNKCLLGVPENSSWGCRTINQQKLLINGFGVLGGKIREFLGSPRGSQNKKCTNNEQGIHK